MTDRVVSIRITSDGRAFVVDQAANVQAVQQLGKAAEATGKQLDTAAEKVTRKGRAAKAAAADVKELGDAAGAAEPKVKKVGDEAGAATDKVARKGKASKQAATEVKELGDAAQRSEPPVKKIGDTAAGASEGVLKVTAAAGAALPGLKNVGDQASGVAPKFKGVGDGAAAAEPKLKGMGDQAARTAMQMRQVAPQITDIVTQIAGGQSPIQILIQQGGQLKDVFGGVGPAVSAVTRYIGGMISPLTVGAGAVGALAVAYYQGSEQSAAFTRELIISGNAAGVTESSYAMMAQRLAAIGGSQGGALDALSQIAREGKVAGEQLERYTAIAQSMERVVGKAVEDTAKEFGALAGAPVEASLKLNQTYNYLTASVYSQIKALQDQGRQQEAVKLAQEAYAASLAVRIPQLEATLGTFQRAWREIGDVAKRAWDQMLGIGRQDTIAQQLVAVTDELNRARGNNKNMAHRLPWQASEAELQQQQAFLQEMVRLERRGADAAAEHAKQVAARGRLDSMAEASLSKQEKLKRSIAKIEADGATAQWTRKQIDDLIGAERKKYEDTSGDAGRNDALGARLAAIKRATELEAIAIKSGIDQVNVAYRLGEVTQAEHIERVAALELKQLETRRAAVAEEIEIAGKAKNSKKAVADLQGQLAVEEAKITERRKQLQEELATSLKERVTKEAIEAAKAHEALFAELDRGVVTLGEQILAQREHNATLGLTKTALAAVHAAKLEDMASSKERLASLADEIDWTRKLGDTYRDQAQALRQLAQLKRQGGAKEETLEAATDLRREAAKTGEFLERTLLESVQRGFEQGKKFSDGFFASLKATAKTSGIQIGVGFFTDATGLTRNSGVSRAGGMLNSASNAGSLYSAVSGYSSGVNTVAGMFGAGSTAGASAASLGYANMVGAAGGDALGAMIAANGSWGGVAASGAAAGGAAGSAGLMGTLGAAMPYLAVAALVIGALMKKGGGPKQDGQFGATAGMNTLGGQIASGQFGGNELAAGVKPIVQGMQGQYAGYERMFGLDKMDFGVAVTRDPKGTAPTMLELTATRGGNTVFSNINRNVARGDEDLNQAFEIMVTDGLLGALKANATKLPNTIVQYLDSVAPGADLDTKKAALASIQAVSAFTDQFSGLGGVFSRLGTISVQARTELIKVGGGLEAITNATASYFQHYYSEAERAGILANRVAQEMTKLGHSAVDTIPEFRQLVEAIDPNTEAGRALYAQLMQLEHAFFEVHDQSKQLKEAEEARKQAIQDNERTLVDAYNREADALRDRQKRLEDFINVLQRFSRSLSMGGLAQLSPMAQLDATRAEFQRVAALAMGGDEQAQSNYQSVAEAFLEASKAVNTSSVAYFADRDQVLSMTRQLEISGRAQIDVGKLQLDALKALVAPLVKIDTSVLTVREAIAQLKLSGGGMGATSGGGIGSAVAATGSAAQSAVTQLYADLFARAPDPGGLALWTGILESGKSIDYVRGEMQKAPEWLNAPRFAAGGVHAGGARIVGEETPELEITGPSRIFNAEQLLRMVSDAGGQRVNATEIRRQTSAIERTGRLIERLAVSIDGSTAENAEQLRGLKQHLAHVLSKRAAA
jgi:phage-related minor tail protein